jgi:hypothetical protein
LLLNQISRSHGSEPFPPDAHPHDHPSDSIEARSFPDFQCREP